MFGDDVLPIDELKLIRSAQAMLFKNIFRHNRDFIDILAPMDFL